MEHKYLSVKICANWSFPTQFVLSNLCRDPAMFEEFHSSVAPVSFPPTSPSINAWPPHLITYGHETTASS
jgi:hypothetical protein